MKRKDKTTSLPEAQQAGPAGQETGRTFVAIDKVRPDPNQPRKAFDEARLNELAESIKQQGVIQDLLVSHHPAPLRIQEPDLTCSDWTVVNRKGEVEFSGNENSVHLYAGEDNLVDYFQIIDGERRWRAAKLAGLFVVPVAVRMVDESARLSLQVIANQQRENLTALEEAEAYKKEIESGRHTPETLHKALGISRGTLFSRLALNKLTKPVREALLRGDISVSVAGLAAMIPDVKQQETFLEEVGPTEWDTCMSFREAQELLEREFCRQLKGAPFDQEKVYEGDFKITSSDGKLSPVTLRSYGACKDCQHRTGNMEIETKNPNVCTQPKCFKAKVDVAATEAIAAAQAKGAKVLTEKQSKKVFSSYNTNEPTHNSGYSLLSEYCHEASGNKTYKDLLGKDAPEPVLALNPDGKLIPVYSKEELKAKLKEKGIKLSSQSSTSDYAEQERKRKEKQKTLLAVAEKALPLVLERVKAEPTIKLLRLLALKTCYTNSYLQRHQLREAGSTGNSPIKLLNNRVEKMSETELKAAVVEAEWCGDLVQHWAAKFGDEFEAICAAYKVDLDKLQEAAKAEAKKGTKEGKTKPKKGKK